MSEKLTAQELAQWLEAQSSWWGPKHEQAAAMLREQAETIERRHGLVEMLHIKCADLHMTVKRLRAEIAKLQANAVDIEAIDEWTRDTGDWSWEQMGGTLSGWARGYKGLPGLACSTIVAASFAEASRKCAELNQQKAEEDTQAEEKEESALDKRISKCRKTGAGTTTVWEEIRDRLAKLERKHGE